MIINSLEIENFRNITRLKLKLNEKNNVIYGKNGFGKTSILEAIFFILNLSSFRSSKKATIKDGKQYVKLSLIFDKVNKIDILYNTSVTKVFINENPIFNYSELKKFNKIVFFNPYDFNIILGTISNKRKILNYNISQINDTYQQLLNEYKNLQKKKKIFLNEEVEYLKLLEINEKLVKIIDQIIEERRKYINQLNHYTSHIKEINISYTYNKINIIELTKIEKKWKRNKISVDIDKIKFEFKEKEIKSIASRGEIKRFIFEIFNAQNQIIYDKYKERPIILIDDLEAEFDDNNIKDILKMFDKNQIIYTKIR